MKTATKTKSITANVEWTGNEYAENPSKVRIEITPKLLKEISLAKSLVKRHKFESIELAVRAEMLDDEGKGHGFRQECERLTVAFYGIYYKAQHKYDATAMIESGDITPLL